MDQLHTQTICPVPTHRAKSMVTQTNKQTKQQTNKTCYKQTNKQTNKQTKTNVELFFLIFLYLFVQVCHVLLEEWTQVFYLVALKGWQLELKERERREEIHKQQPIAIYPCKKLTTEVVGEHSLLSFSEMACHEPSVANSMSLEELFSQISINRL